MKERKLLSGASADGFSPLISSLEHHGGERCFLLLVCSAAVRLVERHCLAPGGLSEIAVVGSVILASLEEVEVAGKIQLPASGTTVRMKTAFERSPTGKFLMFLRRGQ